MNKHINNKNTAFTLIELLIVLVISSITMSYAVPSLRDFVIRQKLSDSANNLTVDLIFLRATAVEYGRKITLLSNNGKDWSQGWTIFIDKNSDSLLAPEEEILRVNESVDEGIIVSSNTKVIVVDNLGAVIGSTPKVEIYHASIGTKITLTTNRSGLTTSSRNN